MVNFKVTEGTLRTIVMHFSLWIYCFGVGLHFEGPVLLLWEILGIGWKILGTLWSTPLGTSSTISGSFKNLSILGYTFF